MIYLDDPAYRGEITYKDKRYIFRAATPEDAGELSELYAEIAINQDNYKTRLDPENSGSFACVGGMFEIHSQRSIEDVIEKGQSFFAVLEDEKDEIISSLWVSPQDPGLAGFASEDFPALSENQRTVLDCALKTGKVVYPREIIVAPAHRCKGMADILCYTVFSAARRDGFTHALGEVYEVCGYRTGGVRSDANMMNNGGVQTILGFAGRFIGTSPCRELQAGNVRVTVRPHVFVLDLDETLSAFKQSIITEGGNTL